MSRKITPAMFDWYTNLSFEEWITFINRKGKQHQEIVRRLNAMSLVDYSQMANDIENAEEPKILEAGSEVKLRIIDVREGTSDKNDCDWFMPVFDVPEHPMAKEFNDFFWHLDPEKLGKKQFARAQWKFKTFADAFGIDLSRPFDLEELISKEGWAILGIRKDDEYGDSNSVKKYVKGR